MVKKIENHQDFLFMMPEQMEDEYLGKTFTLEELHPILQRVALNSDSMYRKEGALLIEPVKKTAKCAKHLKHLKHQKYKLVSYGYNNASCNIGDLTEFGNRIIPSTIPAIFDAIRYYFSKTQVVKNLSNKIL